MTNAELLADADKRTNFILVVGRRGLLREETVRYVHHDAQAIAGDTDSVRDFAERAHDGLMGSFIIDADTMNADAMDILLKVTEESLNLHLYLIARNLDSVPKTLITRGLTVYIEDENPVKDDAYSSPLQWKELSTFPKVAQGINDLLSHGDFRGVYGLVDMTDAIEIDPAQMDIEFAFDTVDSLIKHRWKDGAPKVDALKDIAGFKEIFHANHAQRGKALYAFAIETLEDALGIKEDGNGLH